ncbi:hypothetical protein GCM10009609_48830 [Pseudonocardia aurantiaca]|uniref:Uncharacterized protein n=1 Tax=Pseudonocardia aurantiaca TaxID=75290 RepID=A0ABW4FX60_9PSEU
MAGVVRAKQAVTLQEASGGRFELGLGSGSVMDLRRPGSYYSLQDKVPTRRSPAARDSAVGMTAEAADGSLGVLDLPGEAALVASTSGLDSGAERQAHCARLRRQAAAAGCGGSALRDHVLTVGQVRP